MTALRVRNGLVPTLCFLPMTTSSLLALRRCAGCFLVALVACSNLLAGGPADAGGAAPSIAQVKTEPQPARWANRLWVTSLFAVAGATAADAGTSWGYREANGVLQSRNGTFGARGMAIKLGAVSALIVPEILLRKHRDLRMKFTVGNFVVAGIFTGTSIYNVHAAATQR